MSSIFEKCSRLLKDPQEVPLVEPGDGKSERSTTCLRGATFLCLLITAVLCGYGSYYLVYYFESRLESEQFNSLAEQLQYSSLKSMRNKVQSTEALSNLIHWACPRREMWPNCSVPMLSFLNITDPIADIGELRSIAFGPIFSPDKLVAFEQFAYNFYESEGFPEAGISSFGKGTYALNRTTRLRYRSTGPPSDIAHNNFIINPVMQIAHVQQNKRALMFNLYSEKYRIAAIDHLINCFNASGRFSNCKTITDVLFLVQDATFRPAVLILRPTTALDDPDTLVAVTYGVLNWDTVLTDLLPDFAGKLDVVLSGGERSFTFTLRNGHVDKTTEGDNHESAYDSSKVSFSIPYFDGPVEYELSVYSTKEYSDSFHTSLPVYACIASVAIIVFTSIIFAIHDISMDRKAKERDLIIKTKRLFVRFISHEIRTPMNIVHLGLKLVAQEIADAINQYKLIEDSVVAKMIRNLEDWKSLVLNVEESSDAAIMVLNDLINYDKIQLGTMKLEFEVIDFWEAIRNAAKPFYVQAQHSNISLILDLAVDRQGLDINSHFALSSLRVLADPVKIVQVFRNLLSNALKFTPAGGDVTVTVDFVKDGLPRSDMSGFKDEFSFTKEGSIKVSVRDTGAGISEENQKLLFKEGLQFHANQLQAGGGSGLGLWISKGVVVLHGGSLTALSEGEGCGSEFILEIPAGEVDPSNSPECAFNTDKVSKTLEQSPSYSERDMELPGKKIENILVVDDSEINRKFVIRLLLRNGYNCYEAFDGVNSLERFDALLSSGIQVDAILLDYEMPNMKGPVAASEFRKRGVTVPIVGVTGNVLKADRTTFIQHGANVVLTKPLNFDKLMKVFERFSTPGVRLGSFNDVDNQELDKIAVTL